MSRNNRDSDPDIWGPGKWSAIHTLGAFCDNTLARSNDMFITFEQFKASVICLLKNLPCEDCRGHADRYLKQNPITSELQNYRHPQFGNIGAFVWTWKFHSAVNARKQKSNINLETAWRIYRQEKCADGRCRDITIVNQSDNSTPSSSPASNPPTTPRQNITNNNTTNGGQRSNQTNYDNSNFSFVSTPYRRAPAQNHSSVNNSSQNHSSQNHSSQNHSSQNNHGRVFKTANLQITYNTRKR